MSSKSDKTELIDLSESSDRRYSTSAARMKQFGAQLTKLLRQKNWNQSDLSRHADIGRDSVSQYVNGKSFPSPRNLEKIANSFMMEPKDLFPQGNVEASPDDLPQFQIRQSPGSTEHCWLIVNKKVKFSTATKIAELLESDN